MKRIPAGFLPAVSVSQRAKWPLYRQLYDWFRTAILNGQMRAGQRVPSTRSLAAELNISRLPVLNAYDQLIAEGYFETFPGAGTCVTRAIPEESMRPALVDARQGPRPVLQGAGRRVLSHRGATLAAAPPQSWLDTLGPFRVSLPALDRFPLRTWAKLVARHARISSPADMAYSHAMGYPPLREAIADYLRTVRGVRCEASQILITTGSQQALQLSAQVLLNGGDSVCMEDPGYPGARDAFLSAGARLLPLSTDDEGARVDELSRKRNVRLVYVTPSHQYPLGAALGAARRMLLLHWATNSGAWIVEDDYDSEYRFAGHPIAALQGLDTDGRVIYIGTFSKVMFPALRLGYVVIPPDLVRAFAVARDAADIFSSTLYQVVMTDFIREGHFARHIRRMRKLYAERRHTLVEAVRQRMGDTVQIVGAEAGMHLVLLLPLGIDDVAIAKSAAQKGICAMPLSSCCLVPPHRGGMVLGYGGANTAQIRDGIRKLGAVIEEGLV